MQQKGQITLLLQGSPSCWCHCPLGPQDRNPGAAPDTLSQAPRPDNLSPKYFYTSCTLAFSSFEILVFSFLFLSFRLLIGLSPLPCSLPSSPPSCPLPQRLHLLPSPPSCSPVLQGWGPCHLPSLILFPPCLLFHKGLPCWLTWFCFSPLGLAHAYFCLD